MLRDHIARVIAARMARELAAGGPVRWTPALRFLPTALEHTPSGFLGSRPPVQIPYSSIYSFNMEQGIFYIVAKDMAKAAVQVPCAAPNFYPGYLLLMSFCRKPEGTAAAPERQDRR